MWCNNSKCFTHEINFQKTGVYFWLSIIPLYACTELRTMGHDSLLDNGCAPTMPVIFNVFSIQCFLPRNIARLVVVIPVKWRSESLGYDAISRDNSSRHSGKACFRFPQGHQQDLFRMHLVLFLFLILHSQH